MARVVLTPYGSTGDVHPFLALGRALRDRGDDVVVAVDAAHRDAVAVAGLAGHTLPYPQRDALGKHEDLLAQASAQAFLQTLVERHIAPGLIPTAASLRNLCAGADLLVASPLQLAAPIVADGLDLPWATLTATPLSVPSDTFTTGAGPVTGLARRLPWSLAGGPLRQHADTAVNAARRRWGLPPRDDVLGVGALSPRATAVAVSPSFFPRPPDWPAAARLTGFVFDERIPNGEALVDPLRRFLIAQPPVVAVCAGSIAPVMLQDLMPFYRAAVGAIREIGARPLLLGTGLPDGPLEGGLALSCAPLAEVCRHCATIIHHGGTGTTALALRAGVPALVVPWARWAADRRLNAERLEALGAGWWLPRERFDAATAAAALRALLHEPSHVTGARTVAERLGREDGVGELCRAVTELHGTGRAAVP